MKNEKHEGMKSDKVFSTHMDLPKETRVKIISLLNQRLADTLDLASQVKHAHWNIKGMQFIALHEFFDQLHARLENSADEIAERATAMGGVVTGTLKHAAGNSKIPAYPEDAVTGKDHLNALVERYGTLGAAVRKAISTCDEIDDAGTADLFTRVSQEVDKDLWFLEAHLQD